MSIAPICIDQREAQDRRSMNTRRINGKRRNALEQRAVEGTGFLEKHRLSFNIISFILGLVVGLAMLSITGLMEGMSSVAWKIILGATVAYSYLVAFRRGFYTRE